MIAYASYNKKQSGIVQNAFTIGIADAVIAIFAGFIVFATLGFMADQQGVAFEEVVASGPGLAFVVFPQALSMMPFASFFSILFFLTLLTLAINGAFALAEAINTTILDKINISRQKVAFVVCTLGFLGGIIYTTNGGLFLLDIVDHFVTNVSLLVIGIMECIAVGWIFGADKMRRYINKVSDSKIGEWWDVSIKYIILLALGTIVALQLRAEFIENYGGYPDWAILIGWLFVLVPLAIAFLIPQKNGKVEA